MEHRKIRIGITQGDTNGVGYELIFKTFSEPEIFEIGTPVVYGSPRVATYHRKALNAQTNFLIVENGSEAQDGKLNLVSCFDEEVKIDLGQATKEAGTAARLALERATRELKEGKIDVLVTTPICKESIRCAEFPFSGHTEYLQTSLGEKGDEALMILFGERLRVALVTTHLPLRAVPDAITPKNVERKLRLFEDSLKRDFLLSVPRIAVLGLNPHNGDGGTIGQEENEVIRPVIDKLVAEGMHIYGPYAADGFFGRGDYKHFDGVLAMYHDQGLAPFKTIAMGRGVNFTAGLPFVRTSPDHGTAFEIAGKGVASEESFRQALYSAIDIFRNRRRDDEAHLDPLPKLFHDKREDERPKRFVRDEEGKLPAENSEQQA